MMHTMSVIPHHDSWLHEQDPAAWPWREDVQSASGAWLAADDVLGLSWPGAETVVPDVLQRAASGQLPLHEARQTLALYQEEQARTAPCWTRVSPHPERQGAGQIGAAAYAYHPIPTAEAVATLGLGRILSEIEAATRAVSQAILAQAQEHVARHERLLHVEQMLGLEHAPIELTHPRQPLPRTGRMFALPANGRGHLAAGVAVLGIVMAVLCLVIGILLPLALVVPALFIWLCGAIG